MKKRMLSLALALVMALAVLPMGAMAAEEGPVIIQLPDEITGVGAPSSARKFSEGLLVVYTGEATYNEEYDYMDYSNVRYGYVDKTGKMVIPMEYENVGAVFSGGLVSAKKDGKWGVIDTTGKVVIPFQADRYIGEFSGNAAPVQVKVGETYKWGLIDKTGKTLLAAKYDQISAVDGDGCEGLFMLTKQDENWKRSVGVADDSGKIVVPVEYDDVRFALAGIFTVEKDEKWGLYSTKHGETHAPEYDRILSFSEDTAAVQKDGKWGFLFENGREVVPCQYDDARGVSESAAAVKKDGKWGYISSLGEVWVPFQYDGAEDFSGGLARVRTGSDYSYIDIGGVTIHPKSKAVKVIGYDAEYTGTFTNGLAAWSAPGWSWTEQILIDETGKTVVPKGFQGASTSRPSPEDCSEEGLITLCMEIDETDQWGNKMTKPGVADRAGNVVIPFGEYDFIENISDGGVTVAWTKKGDKTTFYILDFSGMTLPLQDPTQTLVGLVEKPEEKPAEEPKVEPEPATYTGKPTNDALKVDGVSQAPTVYKIGDSNYFQLRDVAMMLNGTKAQFSVDYDAGRQAVIIVTGQPYKPLGTELAGAAQSDAEAILGNNDIYINGVKTDFAVYKINGSNFFQIRALGQALGFNVGWTAEEGMFIESDKPYVSP